MSAPSRSSIRNTPTQEQQRPDREEPNKHLSTCTSIPTKSSVTHKLLVHTLNSMRACLPSSRPKTLSKAPTLSSIAPSRNIQYAPNAAPPALQFPNLSCPYLLSQSGEQFPYSNTLPPSSSHPPSILPIDPNYIPHTSHPTPLSPCIHLRGGSSHDSSSHSNPSGPSAPANQKGHKRLADDERAPPMLWWFAGGRSFPPPTGKQLREGKKLERERQIAKAEKRKAKKNAGGGGFLGKLFGGKGKKGGGNGGGGNGGGPAPSGGSSHRGG
ncbi:MAG: hypothetical protein M1812_004084 [Candelaria pacifica]|nr:MAG: hypothetical protein M1812_004084 [Candelaria pacifica]